MAADPYQACPCGSGKKIKWCSTKLLPQVEKVLQLIKGDQVDGALRILDKLAVEHSEPACQQMYVQSLRVSALFEAKQPEAALTHLNSLIERFADCGLPSNIKADIHRAAGDVGGAAELYREALVRYPVEATEHRARTLFNLGACHAAKTRPLAAWACWQQSLKALPGYDQSVEALAAYGKSAFVSNAARHGLRLKSPDELAVFNEERREKWNRALAGERDWHLDDLKMAFDYLARDDAYDQAAWYNLGLVNAWMGNNIEAIDAFDHYVRNETDENAAAEVWDLCEVLRMGGGAEERNDSLQYYTIYQTADWEAAIARLESWTNLLPLTVAEDQAPLFFITDRDRHSGTVGPLLLSGPPKALARVVLLAENRIALEAFSPDRLQAARPLFDSLMGKLAAPVGEGATTCSASMIDFQPLLIARGARDVRSQQERVMDSVTQYFEEEWINRPLRSLDGLTPLDASGSKLYRKKLEGVVRFRERNFARFKTAYRFDRLRNKLGLMSLIPADVKAADSPLDVGAFSAVQLADLDPSSLSIDQLANAYRAANTLDVPQTALRFAVELTKRDGAAEKLEMIPVFRRLTLDRLERKRFADALGFVDAAIAYDAKHYKGEFNAELRALRARSLSTAGDRPGALKLYRELFDQHPRDLQIVAAAVEESLRHGDLPLAKQFAQLGLERAQEQRQRSFQEQFREYLSESTARAR